MDMDGALETVKVDFMWFFPPLKMMRTMVIWGMEISLCKIKIWGLEIQFSFTCIRLT